MSKLAQAIAFASRVHQDQYDKGGQPYILHCLHVMEHVEPNEDRLFMSRALATMPTAELVEFYRIVAILHDTIEDITEEGLFRFDMAWKGMTKQPPLRIRFGEILLEVFGENVFQCVDSLSHGKEDYLEEYIPRVKECSVCRAVKMADLEHNLDPLRQPTLGDKDLLRLQKYHMAYRMLRGES